VSMPGMEKSRAPRRLLSEGDVEVPRRDERDGSMRSNDIEIGSRSGVRMVGPWWWMSRMGVCVDVSQSHCLEIMVWDVGWSLSFVLVFASRRRWPAWSLVMICGIA
jgi:hypothetical protein